MINHHIILSHYSFCNFDCDYCVLTQQSRRLDNSRDLSPIISDMMARKLINPKAIVEFSGGEPALLPSTPQILELFKANGNPVVFYSNASRFSREIYDYLENSEASYIVTSLDCGSKELFRQKRGRDAFDQVLKNIELYSRAQKSDGQPKVVIKYIFGENNLAENEFEGFIAIADRLRPLRVGLTMDLTLVVGKDGEIIKDIYETISRLIDNAKDRLLRKGLAVEVFSFDKELWKRYYPAERDGERRILRTHLPE